MRGLLFNQITSSPTVLVAGLPPLQVFAASALEERPADPPFAVVRFGTTGRGMGKIVRAHADIWVHDEPGSYVRIDNILAAIRGTLDGVNHLADGVGNEIISAEWTSDSGDLIDQGYRTITKNTGYDLIGRIA